MYCIKCGSKNDDDSIFCVKCGTNLQNDTDINITKINKTAKKDIGIFQKLKKIDIKNKNNIFVTIAVIAIILASIFLLIRSNDNIGSDKNTNIDDDIYISESGQIQTTPTVSIRETIEVSISSIPSGANIYINNISEGHTPNTIKLPEGNYSIKMNITGYKSIISDFNITYDMVRQEINATFEPIDV